MVHASGLQYKQPQQSEHHVAHLMQTLQRRETTILPCEAIIDSSHIDDDCLHAHEQMKHCCRSHDLQPKASIEFNWHIEPARIKICTHADGSDHELGRGGFGLVRALSSSCLITLLHKEHELGNTSCHAAPSATLCPSGCALCCELLFGYRGGFDAAHPLSWPIGL